MPWPYRSPARLRFLQRVENFCLGGEPRAGRTLLWARVRALAPRVLYLNFLADREFAARLAPDCFHSFSLPAHSLRTPFSILFLELQASRPPWAPEWVGRLTPSFLQSNWRFYGEFHCLPEGARSGVLFWCTATTSLALSVFGRRWARCFPLHRAQRMELTQKANELWARIEPGPGSAPSLEFRGRVGSDGTVPEPFQDRFGSFADYTGWVMDQHLSGTVWEREVVLQEMHLGFERARVSAVEPLVVKIPALEEFVETPACPLSCFLVENVHVWLDLIRAVPRPPCPGRQP